MRVQLTARHCEVPETIRDRANELMAKVARFDPRVSAIELIFEEEKRTVTVEAIASRDRVDPVVAKASATEWPAALDALFDRLSRQVRRGRAQAVDHHASPNPLEAMGD